MNKKVVFKFGSGVITRADSLDVNSEQIDLIVKHISLLVSDGVKPIIVSSGAVAAGMSAFNFTERPTAIQQLQASAAVGQSKLIARYAEAFQASQISVAQVLLTSEDFAKPERKENLNNTLDQLLENGIVPILNENDCVATLELSFSDNDHLAAEVATLVSADLLLLCTTVDGLLLSETKKVLAEVTDITSAKQHVEPAEIGRFSIGGMNSKLEAAALATQDGVETVITNGYSPENFAKIIKGESYGTRFRVSALDLK